MAIKAQHGGNTCNPSYLGSVHSETGSSGQTQYKSGKVYLKNNLSEKIWRMGSSVLSSNHNIAEI